MPDQSYLGLELDWWDDSVGAFEPHKVVHRATQTFATVSYDVTDHSEVRYRRELEFWSSHDMPQDRRDSLIRQSNNCYRRNSPTYHFEVSFGSEWRVQGIARRFSVSFLVPHGLPDEFREQLLAFLRSLKMGEPKINRLGGNSEFAS